MASSTLAFLCCLLFAGAVIDNARADCIGDNESYRDWVFQNLLPKSMGYLAQLLDSNFERILPAVNASKWDTYCRELNNIRACIVAQNNNAEEKRTQLAIIDKISPIICNAVIKANFPCLLNVSQHPTQQCQTQCQQFKGSLLEGFSQLTDNVRASPPDMIDVPSNQTQEDLDTITMNNLKSACQYVNCRLNCRKNDITAACQAAGLDAAKTLMQSVASLLQTIYTEWKAEVRRGTPTEPFPAECTPERVIRFGSRRF